MPRLTRLSRSIAGRVALVTGAAIGHGAGDRASVRGRGRQVAVVDRRRGGVEAVAAEITRAGGPAAGYALDVAEPATRRAVARACAAPRADRHPREQRRRRVATPIDGSDYAAPGSARSR